MRVAIYARVSKLDQNPENQTQELENYAKTRNYEIFDIYVDRISGAKESRPRLNDLMNDARARRFDAVVIWKIDRLGRNVVHMGQVIQEWENLGIDLIITTLGVDTSQAAGKLVLGVLMQIAEFERALIRERIILGLERKKREYAKQGKKLGRPQGAHDKKRRTTSGYVLRWANKNKKTTPGKNGVFAKVENEK